MISEPFSCESCIMGKLPDSPHPPSAKQSTVPGELIHSDVCGPVETMSRHGHYYIVSFLDDATKWGQSL